MFVFQFVDGAWRIARQHPVQFPLPVRGAADKLFHTVYDSEHAARDAMIAIRNLFASNPELFAPC
jgi:hypothetical protein